MNLQWGRDTAYKTIVLMLSFVDGPCPHTLPLYPAMQQFIHWTEPTLIFGWVTIVN